jgi:hypothetical protein
MAAKTTTTIKRRRRRLGAGSALDLRRPDPNFDCLLSRGRPQRGTQSGARSRAALKRLGAGRRTRPSIPSPPRGGRRQSHRVVKSTGEPAVAFRVARSLLDLCELGSSIGLGRPPPLPRSWSHSAAREDEGDVVVGSGGDYCAADEGPRSIGCRCHSSRTSRVQICRE